ncbi:MAG: Ribosomal large subunit pseudouridine synthase B [Chlamydiales bacterium]|nr:Ribosomal large subunit pseudouridine synthase B [Chlamydiales bacterium]MCH9619429.1 Ribosomal large subunit pseudouridine synthase B [Chlamydiales bacterium]MCH9622233.1 Ribosomal large subunit pseudouridine synthase B [Chlamydiales bacterium]
MSKIRLNKALKTVASRRAAEKLIFAGRVSVSGKVVLTPQTMVNEGDEIAVDGKPIKWEPRKVYFLLNKPPGYICTAKEGKAKRVLDLFEDSSFRLFTVGRLDQETSGLLLVTNDGDFANQIAHPSFNVPKEYLVKCTEEITDIHLKLLSRGAVVQGTVVRPLSVKKLRRGTLKIVVGEGKKHEVRLLIKAANLTLLDLKRIRIGPLALDNLAPGSYRELSSKELELFHSA